MTTNINNGRVERLLTAVERDIHRHGWDGQPQMLALYDHTQAGSIDWFRQVACGPATRVERYAAAPCVPAATLLPNPVHVLFRLSLNLRHAAHHPATLLARNRLAAPGLFGFALVAEAWRRPTLSPQEQETWGGRRAADIPGAQEMRFAVAACVGRSTHHVIRIRGQKPTATGQNSIDAVGGSVVDSLHTIVAAVTGQPLPPDSHTIPMGWDWATEAAAR